MLRHFRASMVDNNKPSCPFPLTPPPLLCLLTPPSPLSPACPPLSSSHVLDEAERSLHDALCVLSQTVADSRVVWGGGWPEGMMSTHVDELARTTPGKRAMAIDAFANALRAIPTTISDNAGLDSAEIVSQLRADHAKEGSRAGVDVNKGVVSERVRQRVRGWVGERVRESVTEE